MSVADDGMVRDGYWTEGRRADSRALPFEPYRYHRIYEIEHRDRRLYFVDDHIDEAVGWSMAALVSKPSEARREVNYCIDIGGCATTRRAREADDPFARFEGALYG